MQESTKSTSPHEPGWLRWSCPRSKTIQRDGARQPPPFRSTCASWSAPVCVAPRHVLRRACARLTCLYGTALQALPGHCARGRRACLAPARGAMPAVCTADWVPRCSRLRPSQRATAWVAPASGTSRESATGGSTGSAASSARRASRRRLSWNRWTRRDSTWSSRRHRPSPSGGPALAAGAAACEEE